MPVTIFQKPSTAVEEDIFLKDDIDESDLLS